MPDEIEHFAHLLRVLQKIDNEFPLQYAICLCEVSMNEGISLTQLAEKTGMPLSTVSRIIGALSKYRQNGQAFNLIEVTISPSERRKKQLRLTVKGRGVINEIKTAIGNHR